MSRVDVLHPPSLDTFWARAAGPSAPTFDPAAVGHLPPPVRRFLTHAIEEGTPLASAVRLRMRGTIRLKGWRPFTARQVIAPALGMRWEARVGRFPKIVSGFDVVHRGRGAMRWKLLGLVPVMTAQGPDIDKAALARLQAELVWLPSALLPSDAVRWSLDATGRPQARVTHFGWTTTLRYGTDAEGRLRGIDLERWGNSREGAPPVLHPYGARVSDERTFQGRTIPTKVRVAWAHAGDEAFAEKEVFRAEILEATYRP